MPSRAWSRCATASGSLASSRANDVAVLGMHRDGVGLLEDGANQGRDLNGWTVLGMRVSSLR